MNTKCLCSKCKWAVKQTGLHSRWSPYLSTPKSALLFFSWWLLCDELLETSIQILLLFFHCNTSCCRVYGKEMKQNERRDGNCMFSGRMKSVNIPLVAWLLDAWIWLVYLSSGWAKRFFRGKIQRILKEERRSRLSLDLHSTLSQVTVWQRAGFRILRSVTVYCSRLQGDYYLSLLTYSFTYLLRGQAVAHLFEALRYKPRGRGFDSQ